MCSNVGGYSKTLPSFITGFMLMSLVRWRTLKGIQSRKKKSKDEDIRTGQYMEPQNEIIKA